MKIGCLKFLEIAKIAKLTHDISLTFNKLVYNRYNGPHINGNHKFLEHCYCLIKGHDKLMSEQLEHPQ